MELTKPPGLSDVGLGGAVVIVTGAGSGIGAAAARQLGAVGANVVLVGRRKDALEEVAAELGSGRALCVQADLADPDSPARIAGACLDRFGRIDGLVNNAAVVRHMPLGEWDVAGFDEHVATNIRAPSFSSRRRCPRCGSRRCVRWSTSVPRRGSCNGLASRSTG